MRKRMPIVCVKTKATNISQKFLLAALIVSALSSLFVPLEPSQSQLYIVSCILSLP